MSGLDIHARLLGRISFYLHLEGMKASRCNYDVSMWWWETEERLIGEGVELEVGVVRVVRVGRRHR